MIRSLQIPASRGVRLRAPRPAGGAHRRRDLVRRHLVVAEDAQLDGGVDLPQSLDEVVRERIVIVDQQDHATTHSREGIKGPYASPVSP